MTSELNRAREFAQKHHGDQKYGDKPYLVHLEAVYEILDDAGCADDVLVAGILHDVIEDTDATFDLVEENFGITVAGLVWAVTGVGKNRKERIADAYAKILAFPTADAVTLKLGDRIANTIASRSDPSRWAMYAKEWPPFQAKLLPRGGNPSLWARLEREMRAQASTIDH